MKENAFIYLRILSYRSNVWIIFDEEKLFSNLVSYDEWSELKLWFAVRKGQIRFIRK